MLIDIAFLPSLFAGRERSVAIVIDVLRATSSIPALLSRGVPAVYLAPAIDEAASLRDRLAGKRPLLCGEVRGLPPEGFDHGNSPVEFMTMSLPSPPPPVVLATTNGTQALLSARDAPVVLAGALVNGGAVVEAALRHAKEKNLGVTFVCAGTAGRFSVDDAYVAAALAARLIVEAGHAGLPVERTDAVEAGLLIGRGYGWRAGQALRESAHGRALAELGFLDDLALCAQNDRFLAVPRLIAEGLPRMVADGPMA